MNFQAKALNLVTQATNCAVIAIYEKGIISPEAKAVDTASSGLLTTLIKQNELTGKLATTTLLHHVAGVKAERVLVVGFGPKKALSPEQFVKVINKIALIVKRTPSKDLTLCLSDVEVNQHSEAWKAQQSAKLINANLYSFDQLKSGKKAPATLKKGIYQLGDSKNASTVRKALTSGTAIASGMALTRDLGNLPGNICTPSYLSKEAKKLARGNPKLSTKIMGEKQMAELGMGSLLSVSAGSEEPAQLIVMTYQGGKKSDRPTVLVGKGITFDTGGISLKPGAGMDEMKFDMCGAASVFGALKATLEMELPINLTVVVAAAENMPGGKATKPGDVVTSMSGQPNAVLNTAAEGRLVLCDALTYVERFNPKTVIDVATLTGACVVALGKHATGLYSNNDELAESLIKSSYSSQDKAWQMPLWDEYQQQLDSNFADMGNIGGPGGGSITAACFLSRFTKKYHWAHLDIAGTAWHSGAAKGATGRPVAMLVDYLVNQ